MEKNDTRFIDGWKKRLAERDKGVGRIMNVLIMAVDLGTDKVFSRKELLTVARVLYLSGVRYVGK